MLVSFLYRRQKYIIFEDKKLFFLGKIEMSNFIQIDNKDKKKLKKILQLLISKKISKQDLIDLKIIILNKDKQSFSFEKNYVIGLSLNKYQQKILKRNCNRLCTEYHKISIKLLLIIFIGLILIISVIILKNLQKNQLFNEYRNIININKGNDLQMKLVSIKNTKKYNLDDDYVNIQLPSDDYELLKNDRSLDQKISVYQNTKIYIAIIKKKLSNDLPKINDFVLKNDDKISVDDIYNRYNIKDMYDLIYNVVKYNNNKNIKYLSSKQIEDMMFFASLQSIIFPYNKEQKTNKILFFTHQKYGYALISKENINIFLKNRMYEYQIVIKDQNKKKLNMSEQDIINMVSSIEYK